MCIRLFQLFPSCFLLQQLVDDGTSLVRNGMKKQCKASDLIKYLGKVLKWHPHYEGKAKFAFSERNLCLSGRVPGGFVWRPWCVTSTLQAALHPCPPSTTALPTHTDTAGGRVSEEKESKAEGWGKKCFSGSDVWESNERPSSNPVARQPKWYAEGISLKLESKQSLWISKPTTGSPMHPNSIRARVPFLQGGHTGALLS